MKSKIYIALSVLSVVVVLGSIEFLLLQAKYDYFTGGFLQPYYLRTYNDALRFVGYYTTETGCLLTLLALAWFSFPVWRSTHEIILLYYFLVFIGGGLVSLVVARYKVLRYFSDAMNFRLAAELAGGSLADAASYLTNELTLVIGGVVVTLVATFAGHWLLHALLRRSGARPHSGTLGTALRMARAQLAAGALCLALVVVVAISVQRDPQIRHGLAKTIAYNLVASAVSLAYDLSPPFDLAKLRTPEERPCPAVDYVSYRFPLHPANLFIFVLESARADIIGKVVNGKTVTPTLNELAVHGTSVIPAYSHAGFTVPSLKALFTGRQPEQASPDDSLFAVLKQAGYQVVVLSSQSEQLGNIAEATGMMKYATSFFDATFAPDDRLHPSTDPGSMQVSEQRLLAALDKVLATTGTEKPLCIYFNVQAGHFPYYHRFMQHIITDRPLARSQITLDHKAEVAQTYYNAIANADAFIGRALTALQRQGLSEHALVMILGDHGESLFDDDFLGHGHMLNDTQTSIPLVFNRPGIAVRTPIGEDELMDIVLGEIADREGVEAVVSRADEASKAVLQFMGNFHHPSKLGMVEAGGVRTIIDLQAAKIFFSDRALWLTPEEVLRDDRLRQRAARVVALWDRAHRSCSVREVRH